ncbi:hypothetical protein [Secundilactobacillus paracollinoides]|nr:hypothetical protein [Secundilactobacillus paracollinoides]
MNIFFKTILMLALVIVSLKFVPEVTQTALSLSNSNKTNTVLAGYSNVPLMPTRSMLKFEEERPDLHIKATQNLFTNLYAHKLLIFAPTDETKNRLFEHKRIKKSTIRSNIVYVSPEYIRINDLKTNQGKKLTIHENTNFATVLIPKNLSNHTDKIMKIMQKRYFEEASSLGRSLGVSDKLGNNVKIPKLHYQSIKSNPKLIKFFDEYSALKNPIIFVLPQQLMKLPASVFADNIAGDSNNFFFQDKDGQVEKFIRKSIISGDYPKMVSAQKLVATIFDQNVKANTMIGILSFLLVISYLALTLFAAEAYLITNGKTFFLKRLSGYSLLQISSSYFLISSIFWSGVIFVQILNRDGISSIGFCLILGLTDLFISYSAIYLKLKEIRGTDIWK